ncbi:unnamed protein product [Victoria cruziana]
MANSENESSDFMMKMKKTVFMDNVSGQVTDAVIRSAFEQLGTVTNITLIPDYLEQNNASKCFLVEMESEREAENVVETASRLPFMLGGMPRPIRCRMAKPEMFSERPRKSNGKMTCRWIEPSEPDFEVAMRMKELLKKHEAEAFALRKAQLEEEAMLAKKQEETVKSNFKKLQMIEGIVDNGTIHRLADRYGIKLEDD